MPATMRAVRFHAYGPATNLVVDTVDRPEPGAGEVLVRVRAAGVNPFDWKLRAGYLQDFMPVALPFTPGVDLAGLVEATGPDVSGFEAGQAVYGGGTGAYADYALAPARTLARKPEQLSFGEAASIPVGATTAWSSLFDIADLQPGQTVLVHGAAGGVGMFAVQFAHWKGATVIATTSTRNLEFVRALGADRVVDYTTTHFEDVVRNVDAVIDVLGGEITQRSWGVLRPDGILVAMSGGATAEEAAQHGVRAGSPSGQATTALLQEFADLLVAGTIHAEVSQVFPLVEAAAAQALSETGHGRGRIVLQVSQ